MALKGSSSQIIEFTLVYNRTKSRLYNYALKMLYDKMQCEDIIQNIFLKFYQHMDRIRDKERIDVWLFTAVRNEIYTIYRNKNIHVDKYHVQDSDEIDVESGDRIEEAYESNEMREIIMEHLNRMPVEQKEVFLLKEYGELSYKEVSAMLQISEDLVKSRLFKARNKLIQSISKVIL